MIFRALSSLLVGGGNLLLFFINNPHRMYTVFYYVQAFVYYN